LPDNRLIFKSFCFIRSFRYFEDEDEQQHSQLEYIPAPDSPTNKKSECDSDSSEDPLDAFMEGLEKEVCI
jgi:ATP-dependent RNA helicase DDX42